MSKLNVSQKIRDKLAQEIKASQAEKKAKTRYETHKIETKKRGDELKDKIYMESLSEDNHLLEYAEAL